MGSLPNDKKLTEAYKRGGHTVESETGYGRKSSEKNSHRKRVTVETGCRARSGTNRFRILWGVYRMKKFTEWVTV